jgi:SAM-dependent methyltransferase
MNEITEISYWDDGYQKKTSIVPSPADNNENYCEEVLIGRIRESCLEGKRIIEIGGGGSAVLARLALDHPTTQFVCLDYSESGCALIRKFATERGLTNLNAVVCDFREPPSDLGHFDLVYSIGVVEHFTDLPSILKTFASYVTPSGKMMTMIPNMAGSLGYLTKRINRAVYDIHVPHDREDFRDAHFRANLNVISCDYMGSSNFGVLSSCVDGSNRLKWNIYLWLSRLSKAGFLFERKIGDLPTTKLLSPYIFAVSEHR